MPTSIGVETAPAVEISADISVRAADNRRPWLRSAEFWLVVLAFAVRIGFMLAAHTYVLDRSRADDYSYLNETTSIARSIAEGRGFSSPFSAEYTGPSSWIAPLYPYLVAVFFACFGTLTTKAAIALLTLQSAFSALTCIPILGIAGCTVGRRAGLAAALLWAAFPWFSKWALTWVWEISLSTLLFACLFWYALRLAQPATRRMWIGFGALWGVALLVNPSLLLLLPASLAWCGFQLRRRGAEWVKPAAMALVTCVLVLSPWLVRNRVVFGDWVFVRSNFGYELFLGNNRLSMGRGWGGQHPTGNAVEMAHYRDMGELSYVRWRFQEAGHWVRTSKWDFLKLTARRVVYFWDGSAVGYRLLAARYWLPESFGVLSFLLLPAMLVAHRRRLYGWPLFYAAILLYPIPYYLTYSQLRYRHVLEPFMLLLLCYAVAEVLTWRRSAAR